MKLANFRFNILKSGAMIGQNRTICKCLILVLNLELFCFIFLTHIQVHLIGTRGSVAGFYLKRKKEYITLTEAYDRGVIDDFNLCRLLIRSLSSGIVVTRNGEGELYIATLDTFVTTIREQYESRHE